MITTLDELAAQPRLLMAHVYYHDPTILKKLRTRGYSDGDLVQECWLYILRNHHSYDSTKGNLTTWAGWAAYGACRNLLQKTIAPPSSPLHHDVPKAPDIDYSWEDYSFLSPLENEAIYRHYYLSERDNDTASSRGVSLFSQQKTRQRAIKKVRASCLR